MQVSRTVVCSQTAWERSGIQNQGPRLEHSSRSSLASRTFSSVWRQEKVCDLLSTFPLTPKLWSQTYMSWRPPPSAAAEAVRPRRENMGFETSWLGVKAKLCYLLAVRL